MKPLNWLSLYANRSDSFLPTAYGVDLYLQSLPNVSGEGQDYGVAFRPLGDKLVIKVNAYKTNQRMARDTNGTAYAGRMRRVDFDIPTFNGAPVTADTFNLQRLATGWVQAAAVKSGQTLTQDQITTQVASIMGLPKVYFDPLPGAVASADNTAAKGMEIEVNYTPSPSLTMKLNVTKQEVINATISPDIFSWYAERMAVWQKIIDPTTGLPWFTTAYTSVGSAASWVAANVTAPLQLQQSLAGQTKPQVRKYRINYSADYRLAGISENKFIKNCYVGGALRWEDKGAIGYYAADAAMTMYDPTHPIYAKSNLYADVLLGYRTSLFSDKVKAKFQLNVRNVLEDGRLQPIAAYPDGNASAYRIIAPRLFILSATFDL